MADGTARRQKMVNLNIIVEGQAQLSDMRLDVASNAAALRQSLNKFFTRILSSDDVQITIFMGNGFRNAAKRFVTSEGCQCLYVDSDLPYDTREAWFNTLINDFHPDKSIIIPDDRRDRVFFMVQEMEAWFLKQPDCIEKWRLSMNYDRKLPEEDIAQHSVIRNKDIEDINKPSEKLSTLIKKYIFNGKKGVKYGKMSSAPGLLDALDVEALLPIDRELQRFKGTYIESKC